MSRQQTLASDGEPDGDVPSKRLAAVVALVGRAGAGKSHFAAALAAELPEAQILAVSDELRAQLSAEGVEASRSELAQLGQAWIDRSPSTLVELVLARRRPDVRQVIVDGVRHESFLEALADRARPAALTVVWIRTSTDVRHERLVAGGMSSAAVAALEEHATERTIEQWAPSRATRIVDGSAPGTGAVAELAAVLRSAD